MTTTNPPPPKRRPYNASGSLSEYGVFPECDAQQPTEDADAVSAGGWYQGGERTCGPNATTFRFIRDDNGIVAFVEGSRDVAMKRAARIVECVNACTGIADPAAFIRLAKQAGAAQQPAETSITRREQELISAAATHCDNCGCSWLDNGLNPVDCPYCKQRELLTLAEQWERDAGGCRRDGYMDAAVVKENCAFRLRQALGISAIGEALATKQPLAVDEAMTRRIMSEFHANDPGDVWPPDEQGRLRRKALQDAINNVLARQPAAVDGVKVPRGLIKDLLAALQGHRGDLHFRLATLAAQQQDPTM